MNLSRLLSLAAATAGAAAATRVLLRRRDWESGNRHMAICVDYDDAYAAAIRAGVPFAEMLALLARSGATHLSLPEHTLERLLAQGELTPQAPAAPLAAAPAVGHWNYLAGREDLLRHLAEELAERLPYTQACVQDGTLIFAGSLPSIGQIGLGFDTAVADQIRTQGLGAVPRPASYDWPEAALIDRTLHQAGHIGDLVAFAGDFILGHEMYLGDTVAAMARYGLAFVYFAEARHQRGDWFIAKRRAPHVVLAQRFTREELRGMDYHAACHNWAFLARERGIRLCYVNFFRELHAVAPLEGLDYIHHLRHALEDAGYIVTQDAEPPTPIPGPGTADLSLIGVTTAGITAAAIGETLKLPGALSVPLTLAGVAGAAALPYLEQRFLAGAAGHSHDHGHAHDHNHGHDHDHDHDHEHAHDHGHDHGHGHDHDHGHSHLHEEYPPAYTPKLVALGAAALGPVAALGASRNSGWLSGVVYQTAALAALAAATSGQEPQLRIEDYKGFNLDALLPLTAAALTIPQTGLRTAVLTALAGGWLLLRQMGQTDLLAQFDRGHAEGHTHHISAATRFVGDTLMTLGPRPARKWAGLGPAGLATGVVLAGHGRGDLAAVATFAGAAGNMFGLVGFRRSERALVDTLQQAAPSLAAGIAAGMLLLLLGKDTRR